jgi:hypothetical protein
MAGTSKYYTAAVRLGLPTDKMSYQITALPVTAATTDAWLLTSYRDGSVQVDRIPMSDLGLFASVRYMGNATPMTSVEATSIYVGGGMSNNNEPEWSVAASSSQCKECGRVVINTPASPPSA